MKYLAALATLAVVWATPALAQQPAQSPAVETLSRQQLRDELTRLRGYVGNGGVVALRPQGCAAAENRQFDFWLGEWDVSASGVSPTLVVGENSITLHAQGCTIIETWRPFRGASGHSINSYDRSDNKWHQTWADASGRRTEYAGVFENGAMYLEMLNPQPNAQGVTQRQRMNYQALDANTVRQWGETWDEAAQTWTVAWDLTYRRRPNEVR